MKIILDFSDYTVKDMDLMLREIIQVRSALGFMLLGDLKALISESLYNELTFDYPHSDKKVEFTRFLGIPFEIKK